MSTRSRIAVFALMVSSLGITAASSAGSYTVNGPFPIAAFPGAQRIPAACGSVVVWEDNRPGQTCIKGWNMTANEEVLLPNNGPQTCPAICGNVVVWEDSRSGNPDIYGYDRATGHEFPIACTSSAEQSPSIWGDWVVWQQSGAHDADICAYNLVTKESLTVCSHSGDQMSPKIWDDWIVWQDLRTGAVDLYGFNLSTRQETPLVTGPGERGAHAINNGVLAWETIDEMGESDIAAMSLVGGVPWQVCMDPGYQYIPAISDNLIVWGDWRDGIVGIRAYDIGTGESFWVLSPEAERSTILSLAINGNLVVWEDATDWNSDIYGAYVSDTVPEPSSLTALWLGVLGLSAAKRLRSRGRRA